MSAVTDLIDPYLARPPDPEMSILLIDCADLGWRWIGFDMADSTLVREGWAGGRDDALAAAIAACPGWQVIRIA